MAKDPKNVTVRQKGPYLLLKKSACAIETLVKMSGMIFANVTSLGVIVMILIGTLDVVGSNFFNTPVPVAFEATEALMVVVTFGGLAYVQLTKKNIRVDILVNLFPPKLQVISELAGQLFGLCFFGFFTYYAALYFWESFLIREYATALVPFPLYPSKFAMFLGVALLSAQLLVDAVKTTICLITGDIITNQD